MKQIMVIISTVILSICAPLAHASNIVELFDYHGDELKASARQTWLGLYAQENGKFELRATKVSITLVNDAILDEDPKLKTAKRVAVAGKQKPIFVFSGIPGLKAGPVVSSGAKKKEHLEINEKLKLKVGANESTLSVTGKKKNEEYRTGYTITLESGGIKQQIVHAQQISAESAPSLLWCGDLDGDGKIDLIMDTTTHYNVSNVTLFLSSKAKPGKLVKEVANQYSTGC